MKRMSIITAGLTALLLTVPISAQAALSLGDVNGDQAVDSSDAADLLIALANIGAGMDSGLSEEQLAVADVDGDGAYTAADATITLQYAAFIGAGGTGTVPEYLQGLEIEGAMNMTLDEKICQLFIVNPELLTQSGTITSADSSLHDALQTYPVGGIILFGGNLTSIDQTRTMLSDMQSFAQEDGGAGLFLAVDEEGGYVARCANNLGTPSVSPMAVYGERNSRVEAEQVGQVLSDTLHSIGFNLDFAPVADVDLNPNNELGSRIFSSDPAVVANMVGGVVTGIQRDNFVAATLKHFPGLGAEDGNTHTDTKVTVYRTMDELRAEEFVPFRGGIEAGADFVMVSHATVTGIGDDLPACVSPIVCTDLLRNELGFEGLIVTDSMQMYTISKIYSPGEASVMALEAGVDVLLMPDDLGAAVQGVHDAVTSGRLSEVRIDESVRRILKEKQKLGIPIGKS